MLFDGDSMILLYLPMLWDHGNLRIHSMLYLLIILAMNKHQKKIAVRNVVILKENRSFNDRGA